MAEGHIEFTLSVCVCVPESCPGHNSAVHDFILFYPITMEGRRGTTDEFAIPFHLDLFSAALVELASPFLSTL